VEELSCRSRERIAFWEVARSMSSSVCDFSISSVRVVRVVVRWVFLVDRSVRCVVSLVSSALVLVSSVSSARVVVLVVGDVGGERWCCCCCIGLGGVGEGMEFVRVVNALCASSLAQLAS